MLFIVKLQAWELRDLNGSEISARDLSSKHLMANSSSDLYLHYFYFQAFGDELDVRQSDFESVRSQGDRLICQLSDHTERETLSKQMDDISYRLDRIQNLVNDRGREHDSRYRAVKELNSALNDCNDRIVQLRTSLRNIQDLESFGESGDRFQEQVRLTFTWVFV